MRLAVGRRGDRPDVAQVAAVRVRLTETREELATTASRYSARHL